MVGETLHILYIHAYAFSTLLNLDLECYICVTLHYSSLYYYLLSLQYTVLHTYFFLHILFYILLFLFSTSFFFYIFMYILCVCIPYNCTVHGADLTNISLLVILVSLLVYFIQIKS